MVEVPTTATPLAHAYALDRTLPTKSRLEELDLKDVTVWVDPLDATKEFTEVLLECVRRRMASAFARLARSPPAGPQRRRAHAAPLAEGAQVSEQQLPRVPEPLCARHDAK